MWCPKGSAYSTAITGSLVRKTAPGRLWVPATVLPPRSQNPFEVTPGSDAPADQPLATFSNRRESRGRRMGVAAFMLKRSLLIRLGRRAQEGISEQLTTAVYKWSREQKRDQYKAGMVGRIAIPRSVDEEAAKLSGTIEIIAVPMRCTRVACGAPFQRSSFTNRSFLTVSGKTIFLWRFAISSSHWCLDFFLDMLRVVKRLRAR